MSVRTCAIASIIEGIVYEYGIEFIDENRIQGK